MGIRSDGAEAMSDNVSSASDNLTDSRFHNSSSSFSSFNFSLNDNNSSVNESESDWGPKRDALYIVIPITSIYILIFLTGLIGNVSTCIVIFRNRSMHTATNFYLFSLAVSDLLLLVAGMPQEMYSIWSRYPYVFGETFCVIQGLAAETSANATVLTITAFTIERYVAICHPFLSHTLSKLSRAIRLVFGLWAVALCLAIPQALEFGVFHEKRPDGQYHPDHKLCGVTRVILPHAFELSTILFFMFPMTLITVLYVLIGIRLNRSSSIARSNSIPLDTSDSLTMNPQTPVNLRDSRRHYIRSAQNRATRHVVKMLVAVVAAFFVCWAPFHAQRLLAIHGYSSEGETSPRIVALYNALTYISGILYYFSTTVNPVLYHIMSNKFRDAFKDTLSRCVGGKRRGIHSRRRLYSGISRSSRTIPDTITATESSVCCREDGINLVAPRRANSLRYLEGDVARQGQRPLVVSFRRPQPSTPASDVRVYVSLDPGRRSKPAAYLSVLYKNPSDSMNTKRSCSATLHENRATAAAASACCVCQP